MSDNGINWRNRIIEYGTKPADQFQANPQNWRKHPQRQRDAVRTSLNALGWVGAVIENRRTGHVIDGHERIWQALQDNADVPYLLVDLTEDEERLALASLDPLTMMAEADAGMLDALLADIRSGADLLADAPDVDLMLREIAADAGVGPLPESWEEYDESIADNVEYCECPNCGHRWPR